MSNQLCPRCKGGNTHEKSFAVYYNEDGSSFGICFRASCGHTEGARQGTIRTPRAAHRAGSGTSIRFLQEPNTIPLTDRGWYELNKYDIFTEETGVPNRLATMRDDGIYWYIPLIMDRIDARGARSASVYAGYVLRRLVNKEGGPKSLTHLNHSPMGDLYYPDYRVPVDMRTTFLVEDPMSCIAVRSSGYNAYTLLGTRVPRRTRELLYRILQAPDRQVILALDADATDQAIAIKRRWFKPSNFKVLRLTEDLKDMDATKRIELLASAAD